MLEIHFTRSDYYYYCCCYVSSKYFVSSAMQRSGQLGLSSHRESINRVPALAGVMAVTSPRAGGR